MDMNRTSWHGANRNSRQDPQRIDVVYLWVDGSDPRWQARRQLAFSDWTSCHASSDLALYGNVLGRYRDNGELRFNLRALEKFFPDHGHIYVVTDGQVPPWLRNRHGLTVVEHRDLMPSASLPVFNSGHIESYIHHIPGLAERFFYLNDDVFFGAPVNPSAWFEPQLTVAMEATPVPMLDEPSPKETSLVNAAAISAKWLKSRYPGYRHDSRVYAHAPRPMLRSAMYELERLAPELFRQLRSTVFRSWKVPPIISDLAIRWMVHVGLAREVSAEPVYISTGDPSADQAFALLENRFGQIPFFCINDTCDDAPIDDPRLLRVSNVLKRMLPQPSFFERMTESFDAGAQRRAAMSTLLRGQPLAAGQVDFS